MLSVTKTLKINVTKHVSTSKSDSGLEEKLTLAGIKELEGYVTYTPDIDIESRVRAIKECNSTIDPEVTIVMKRNLLM